MLQQGKVSLVCDSQGPFVSVRTQFVLPLCAYKKTVEDFNIRHETALSAVEGQKIVVFCAVVTEIIELH